MTRNAAATLIIWGVALTGLAAVLVAMATHGPNNRAEPIADLTTLWNLYGAAEWERLKATGNVFWDDRVAVLLFLIWWRLDRIVALLKQIAARD